MRFQRLPEGAVKCVDRAVSFADGVLDHSIGDPELDGRLG